MPSFKFFSCYEWHEFEKWNNKNNTDPIKMLKRYMRLSVILDADLSDSDVITLNNKIKGY